MNPNNNSPNKGTETISKREDKKRIAIKWNSALFFQVGLIVSLLLSWAAIESDWRLDSNYMAFEDRTRVEDGFIPTNYVIEPDPIVKKEPVKKVEPQKRNMVTPASTFTQVSNNDPVKESDFAPTDTSSDKNIEIPEGPTITGPKTPETKTAITVENIPVFPGCEGMTNNEDRIACLNQKIRSFINKKFDVDRFSEKYAGENKRVSVIFTVNSRGEVSDIKARSTEKDLEKEAVRVVSKLPKLAPGTHNGKPVNVLYSIPILLNIKN